MTSSLNNTLRLVAAGFLALSATSLVHAQIVVPNGSFESPAETSDTLSVAGAGGSTGQPATDTLITDWTAQLGLYNYGVTGIAYLPGNSQYDGTTGADGSQAAILFPFYGYVGATLTSGNLTNNDGTPAGSTGFVTTVAANTTYTLSALIGIPTGADAGSSTSGNDSNGDQSTFTLNLIDSAGNTVASNQVLVTSLSVGSFAPLTLTYTSGSAPSDLGDGLQIQFALQNSYQDSHSAVEIDNVSLSVPEPSTYALLFGGLAILGLAVRNAKKFNFNS